MPSCSLTDESASTNIEDQAVRTAGGFFEKMEQTEPARRVKIEEIGLKTSVHERLIETALFAGFLFLMGGHSTHPFDAARIDFHGDPTFPERDYGFLSGISVLPPLDEEVGILSTRRPGQGSENLGTVLADLDLSDRLEAFQERLITSGTLHANLTAVEEIVPEESVRNLLLKRVGTREEVDEAQIISRFLELGRKRFPDGLSQGEALGQGAIGILHGVLEEEDYVLKSTRDPAYSRFLLKEAVVLEECGGSGGVVDSYGCVEIDGELTIVLDRRDGGTLADWLFHGSDRLPRSEKFRILFHISAGLNNQVHGRGYAHCDLKPESILRDYSSLSCVSLAGFGLSVRWEDCMSGVNPRGTPGYMPPSFDGDPRKIDAFSFGIVAWEVWTQKRAYGEERQQVESAVRDRYEGDQPSMSEGAMAKFHRKTVLQFVESIKEKRPDLDCSACADMPLELKHLVQKCWSARPEDRPTASEIFHVALSLSKAEDELDTD